MMVSAENDPRPAGVIWALNLDEPRPAVAARLPARFGPVDADSASALVQAVGAGSSAEILNRFQTGRRCYAAWVGDQLAAYGWVSFNEEYIGELKLLLKLIPGEAYIWDCATLPAFRQNHFYSALLAYILEELCAQNFCRVWIGADLDNIASQRGIARAGFHAVADLIIARVLTLHWTWVQGRPGMPESLVAEARRAFLNNRHK